MNYQPRIKSPKGAVHGYKKTLRERSKDKKRSHKPVLEEKHDSTEKEVSELTLKRLHTLGSQKFGSSPFSQHFDRWLTDVEVVLSEFEAHPSIGVDVVFVRERSEALDVIGLQLEERRQKETALEQEITSLSYYKSRLQQINTEYATKTSAVKNRKNSETKRLYRTINQLKKEQNNIMWMKTNFFRDLFRRSREQKEVEIAQQLNDVQRKLELVLLAFRVEQRQLRDEFDGKRQPVLEQIKGFQKIMRDMEVDGSLEERWFACEALIDAVNGFLMRKPSSRINSLK
jgi:hypothetical protein